jgi:subtilisin family serine protease
MDPALWELLRAEAGADGDRVLEAIIRLARPGIEIPGVRIISRFGAIVTCRIHAQDVIPVRARPDVLSVKAARVLSPGFQPAAESPHLAGPALPIPCPADIRRSPELGLTGVGVVVAAVDWGVDVDSAAFRWPDDPVAEEAGHEAGATRFLSLWDQRDQAVGPRPDPYGYGSVHTRAEIDGALRDPRPYQRLGYHPAVSDPAGRGTHGTRTMDIAAGNGEAGGPAGIAPGADLIFVHLADRNTGGLANFGDSVRLLEAVDFISRTAGPQPCVINISAGRVCGPKDGTTLVERAFDELLAARPGRFIVNSAGNYFNWRTHSCGRIAAGEQHSLTFVSDPADITVNEVEIWYDGADEFAVRIDPPGYAGGRSVRLGERSDLLAGGRLVGRVYHRKHDPNNGDNHIVAYLSPIGRAGRWTVTLEARRVSSGRFHAWIERDDACPDCQARFTPDDSRRATTVGSIATSHLPLIVGAYDGHDPARRIGPFSSAGPGRDGRVKPDLAAPGVRVLAARSAPAEADHNPGLLVRGSGTSFATPHVTGAVALCFEAAGARLGAYDIRSLVLGSCDPVPDADPLCRLGRGYLNISRLAADVQQALAAPAIARSAKESTMDTEDTIVVLAAAPDRAYREYLYRPQSQLARWIDDRYDVVARPGQRVARPPQRGDVLIEAELGWMGGGRCVILDGSELDAMGSRPWLPQGQLILRPLPRVEMSEPLPVEPPPVETASEADHTALDRLIGQGLSENQITDTLFYAGHPAQSGTALRADTRAAREWRSLRDTQVRPGVRQQLVVSAIDPVQLAVFLSQYENDSRVPPEYTKRFLTGTPLLSMGRTLRDRVIHNWLDGGRPLTAHGLYELALETAGDPGTAELLCHNVTKALAVGGVAITWHETGTQGEYTDGQTTHTAKIRNSAGQLKYHRMGREVVSIFYLLFSAGEFGTDDPRDWYHYFVTATMAMLASTGSLGPATGRGLRREDARSDAEGRGGWVGAAVYRGLVSDRVADLEKQMTDPALTAVPGYRGWVLANVLGFLEGGYYGKQFAADQADVLRESKVHVRGAVFGLRTIGGSPGKTWRWYVPAAGSLSDADLATGFELKGKTAQVWGPDAKPAAGEAATDDADGAELAGELLADSAEDVGGEWFPDNGQFSLAEFTGPEHKDIGDAGSGRESSSIHFGNPPQPLTFGDVVSMAGDYFGTYEQMRDLGTTAEGRAQLDWARWHCLGLKRAGVPEPRVTELVKKSVTDQYLLLATRNLSHFSAGGTAWQAYTMWHGKAIADALQAGQASDQAVWRRALTKEAFGDHFLTDMFSAGHVRTPRAEIRDWYDRYFPGSEKFVSYMARYIFDRLDERQQLPPLLWWVGWLTRSIMADRIMAMGGEAVKSFSLGDIVSLALHDRDNKGLVVVSQVDAAGQAVPGGYTWTAVGDGHLGRNAQGAQTKAMATAGVIASLRDLERVRGVGVKLGTSPATIAQKTDEIGRALGPAGFAARAYIPRQSTVPGANVPLTCSDGSQAPLEWRWGHLGGAAFTAVDETVRGTIAGELHEMAGTIQDPVNAGLGMRIYGTRNAFLSFVRHLRTDGITAIEKAVGRAAR